MKILKTKAHTYLVTVNADSTLTISHLATGNPIQNAGMFINSYGGVEKVVAACKEYNSIEDFTAELEAEKSERQEKNAQMMERIAEMRKNELSAMTEANRKIAELYYQCQEITAEMGWQRVELLIGKNELAAAMIAKLGEGYSATPYDNGAIYIKTDSGKKFSMFKRVPTRKQLTLSDLIN